MEFPENGGMAAFGEVSDLDWTTFTKVMWTSADGIEWTRTDLKDELAEETDRFVGAFGAYELLIVALGSETTPRLAVTSDLTNWEIYELDTELFDPGIPISALIEHDNLTITVGGMTGIVINQPPKG